MTHSTTVPQCRAMVPHSSAFCSLSFGHAGPHYGHDPDGVTIFWAKAYGPPKVYIEPYLIDPKDNDR